MEVIIITKRFLCGHLAHISLFHVHKTSIWNIYSKTKKQDTVNSNTKLMCSCLHS